MTTPQFIKLVTTALCLFILQAVCAADQDSFKCAPLSFWSMEIERQTPFNIEIVSSTTNGDYKTDQFYLSSQPFGSGEPDRVLCTFSRIVKPGVVSPAYIEISGNGDQTPASAEAAARQLNTAVLTVEWRAANAHVRSKWSQNHNTNVWGALPIPTDCFVYAIAMAARRVIDYLCDQHEIDPHRIAVGGTSFGGWFALLIAGIDSRVSCINVIWGAGGHQANHGGHASISNHPDSSKEERENWISHFDPLLYSRNIKAKTIIYTGTNDEGFWLGDVVTQYNAIPADKRLVLLPNFNHGRSAFGYAWPNIGKPWFGAIFNHDERYPSIGDPIPIGTGSEYTFECSDTVPIARASLYWSFGNQIWPARYWIEIPAHIDGSKWTADIPPHFDSLEGCVFASLIDKNGRALSSRYVVRAGKDARTAEECHWRGDAIWDVERGVGAWRIPAVIFIKQSAMGTSLQQIGDTGLKITPDSTSHMFVLLTNSIALNNAEASKRKGLHLVIDGMGQAGELHVSLGRNTGGYKSEIDYAKVVQYTIGVSTIDIPWSDFEGPASATTLFPIDDLRFEGARSDKSPFAIQSMSFYD